MNTSTFSSAGKALTSIGTLPLDAGKGVIQGVTGAFKKGGDLTKAGTSSLPPVPGQATGQALQPVGQHDSLAVGAAAFPSANNGSGGNPEPGTLRVTVLDAKDFTIVDVKPYVTLRVADKEVKTKYGGKTTTHEWNESFNFVAGAFSPKLFLWVYDHKTLGKDKLLGEGEVDIWRHVQPDKMSAAEVLVQLRDGQGLVRLRLEFDTDRTGTLVRRPSMSSVDKASATGSPSRFNILGRKSIGTDREGSAD